MTTLYALGCDPVYFYSKPSVAKLDTATNKWSPVVAPSFNSTATSCLKSATTGTIVATASTSGEIQTTDFLQQPWTSLPPTGNPPWMVSNLVAYKDKIFAVKDKIFAVGAIKNPITLLERAIISSDILTNQYSLLYNGDSGTFIYDMTFVDQNHWIAVGSKNDGANPLMIWTKDGGATWNDVDLSKNLVISGSLLSISYDSDSKKIFIGGTGYFATNSLQNLEDPNNPWVFYSNPSFDDISRAVTRIKTFTTLQNNNKITIALSEDKIFYSFNMVDWQSVVQPGYQFCDVEATNNQFWFSADSLLTVSTVFVGTLDKNNVLTILGKNNGVQGGSLLVF
jgi:hypothetical protein